MSDQKNPLGLKGIELTPSVSILIAGIIIAGAILYTNLNPRSVVEAQAPDVQENVSVSLPNDNDHILGSKDAPIVLIEYSDFQCPYCEMIYPSLKQIVTESNGEVSWIMRNYPLYQIHPQAVPAANAAECIAEQLGNAGFWKFTEAVFNDQQNLSPERYAQYASQFGANTAKYTACVSSETYLSRIEAEAADAQANGGNGTPYTVVLNTKTGKQYPISGALPYAQLKAVINKAKSSL